MATPWLSGWLYVRAIPRVRACNLPPDEIEKLSSAFDRALRSLNIADRKDDPIGKIVARKIIEVRETGVRDAAEIADIVVKQLKLT